MSAMSWNDGDGRFLRELVSCRSESGSEDACCSLLERSLPSLGWDYVSRDKVGNVLASRGNGDREILLLGHIDTVPGGPECEVLGDELWGRGSVDAKGSLAAFSLAGGRTELPDGWRYSLVAAVGEERDSRGARYLMTSRGAPAACIVGEPSGGNGITLGYRGCMFLELTSSDEGSHRSIGPGPLTDVLMAASDILREVQRMDDDSKPVINRYNGAVSRMEGVESGGRVAKVGLDIRLPLGASSDELGGLFGDIASRFGVALEVVQQVDAYQSPRSNPVAQALSSSIREVGSPPRLLAKGGTADFNVVAPWMAPMVAYGPGDSSLDHRPDERLPIGDFLSSIDILERALPKVCVLIDR
nr:M20/M25/M40 family metallo-hydrolase [uncultured Dethiosulfovibrio sp.]